MPKQVYKYWVQMGGPVRYGDEHFSPLFKNLMKKVSDSSTEFVPCKSILEADLVLWDGGADVSPLLYGEAASAQTNFSPGRDLNDMVAFHLSSKAKLRVGICRGAQLLNVLSGGRMWQHIDPRGAGMTHFGNHKVLRYSYKDRNDPRSGVESCAEYTVTSTHHQMMRPGPEAVVIGHATADDYTSFSLCKEKFAGPEFINGQRKGPAYSVIIPSDGVWDEDDLIDPEMVWYPKTRSLCIQGHPEYSAASSGFITDFGDMIKEYIVCAD